MNETEQILAELFATIEARRNASPDESYTAQLLADAPQKPVRKLAEEANEVVMAALEGDNAALIYEAADMLYHLLVVLVAADIKWENVLSELEKRRGQSGLAEKAARKNDT